MGTHAKAYFTDGSIVKINKDWVNYNGKYPVAQNDKYSNDICVIEMPRSVERNFINIYYRTDIPEDLDIIGLDTAGLVHSQAYPIFLYKVGGKRTGLCDTERPDLEDKTICVETGENKVLSGDSGK